MATQYAPELPTDRELLTAAEYRRLARNSKSTIARWRRDGIGPQPIKVGPRAIRYRASEVKEFLGLDAKGLA